MSFLVCVLALACYAAAHATPGVEVTLSKRAISQDSLDTFTRFTNFSAGAYLASCPSPMGTNLVLQVHVVPFFASHPSENTVYRPVQ